MGEGVNTGKNPKSYNNPKDWEKIDGKPGQTKIIDVESMNINIVDDEEELIPDELSSEQVEEFEEVESFDEVIELTQYDDSKLPAQTGQTGLSTYVAEYNDINTTVLQEKHKLAAKSFVNKITKFILDFNDVELSEDHKKYIKQVGTLQLQHLEDLLYMVDVNKQMLNNIIARVNASQAEDYSIINSYNNLVNQHLKLIKELQNTYRAIPNVIKKMKADVICNQELENSENGANDEVITAGFGESQFNNGKQLYRSILDKYKNKDDNNNDQKTKVG